MDSRAAYAVALGAALLFGTAVAGAQEAREFTLTFGLSPPAPAQAQPVAKSPKATRRKTATKIATKRKPEQPKKELVAKVPQGPLNIVISIARQRLTLYANGEAVAQSTVSTGVPTHPTPTGVFSIIQKNRFHRSNIYSNAPMPFMQRITWSGVALHQGVVPGRPASHGCIRLPAEFASRLWGYTKLGVRVIVTQDELPAPVEIAHPLLFAPNRAPPVVGDDETGPKIRMATTAGVVDTPPMLDAQVEDEEERIARMMAAAGLAAQDLEDSPEPIEDGKAGKMGKTAAAANPKDRVQLPGPMSVFISRKEGKLYVRKGFDPIYETKVAIAGKDQPLGTHVFTAMDFKDGEAVRWTVVTVPNDISPRKPATKAATKAGAKTAPAPASQAPLAQAVTPAEALGRITIPQRALRRISQLMAPGASLIISDNGLGPETGLGTDFIVLTR